MSKLLFENHPNDSRITGPLSCSQTLNERMGTGGGNVPLVLETFRKTSHPTAGGAQGWEPTDTADCLNVFDNSESRTPILAVAGVFEGNGSRPSHLGDGISDSDVSYTLNATERHGIICKLPKEFDYEVRRLTPKECARLQGFPDDWCADVPHSDSAEYKLWGNGMALPCSLYIMEGIADLLGVEQ